MVVIAASLTTSLFLYKFFPPSSPSLNVVCRSGNQFAFCCMNSISNIALKRRRIAEGMLLLVTLIWGGTFGLIRYMILTEDIGPVSLLALRFDLAAVLIVLLFFKRLRGALTSPLILHGVILGALLYAGYGLETEGLKYTSSTHSGLILALYVVFTPLFEYLFFRRSPSCYVWISLPLVLVGLWCLNTPASGSERGILEIVLTFGDVLMLCCAVVYAIYLIVLNSYGNAHDTIVLTIVQLVTAGLLATGHWALTEPMNLPVSAGGWAGLFYLSFFALVLGIWWQTTYQPRTTPGRAAIILTMESVFAAIIGITILGDQLGPFGYGGAALMIAGIMLIT